MFSRRLLAPVLAVAIVAGCGTASTHKAETLRREQARASMSLPGDAPLDESVADSLGSSHDTLTVIDDRTGEQVLIMRAVKDVDGEMVATEQLQAACVTARFRNVAERNGRVELRFNITVPKDMMDSRWQLRFHPRMEIMGDTLALEDVIITGKAYRRAQLRGYQQYERWLEGIITDTTVFVRRWQLELFLERNLPEVWAMRSDTSFVSDEKFESLFGVTENEAVEHYTDKLRRWYNRWLMGRKEKTFRKFVKVPIETEGLRLDTVIVSDSGDFTYEYVQGLMTRPGLRKVDILLGGEIYEQEKRIYSIPDADPLTFYISSLSAFVDPTERYLLKILERKVSANTACYIAFASGKADMDMSLGSNAEETGRIKDNLRDLMLDSRFDLDSIIVTAFASPEGSMAYNGRLSKRRSESISRYFDDWMGELRDSIDAAKGFSVDENGNVERGSSTRKISFISRSEGENWRMLEKLMEDDPELTASDREVWNELSKVRDLDDRERQMQRRLPSYRHVREALYPRLRVVRFDFHLHRKGMVKDTVHTTVLDSTYMEGVQAIRDHDYRKAVSLLRPYGDYNAAVAYCALGYDASAMEILKTCPRSDRVLYMLAILYSRKGDDQAAVQNYLSACALNPSYVHRGNLDPEISVLIKRYDLEQRQ